MEKNINLSIHNRFDIEVIDSRTGKIKQRVQAENIICNNLYANLCVSTAGYLYFDYIYWGSGSGTPAATDTDLFHHEGKKAGTNSTFNADYVTRVASCTRMIQLDEQTSVGVEISEVGIGRNSNSGGLCTHAMLEDMNGNPITIEKTNVDIINIYATVYIHWSASSHGSFQWGNEPLRGWLFGIGKAYSPGAFYSYVRTTKDLNPWYRSGNFTNDYFYQKNGLKACEFTGSAANKKIEVNMTRLAVEDMNIGGIGMVFMGERAEKARAEAARQNAQAVIQNGGASEVLEKADKLMQSAGLPSLSPVQQKTEIGGTVRVEGVNTQGEFVAAADYSMNEFSKQLERDARLYSYGG